MKSGLTTAPLECFHGHTNFFHELTRVVGKKRSEGSVGLNIYTSGLLLYSSSLVPRWVKSVLINAPIEFIHGTSIIKLTSVLGTQSSDGSMSTTTYSLRSMLCSSYDVSRKVRNEIRPDEYSISILLWTHRFLSWTYKNCRQNRYTSGPVLCSSSVVPRLVTANWNLASWVLQ